MPELSLLVMHLIGEGRLFATGLFAQLPKIVWAILFGNLTMCTGDSSEMFMSQLVRLFFCRMHSRWLSACTLVPDSVSRCPYCRSIGSLRTTLACWQRMTCPSSGSSSRTLSRRDTIRFCLPHTMFSSSPTGRQPRFLLHMTLSR